MLKCVRLNVKLLVLGILIVYAYVRLRDVISKKDFSPENNLKKQSTDRQLPSQLLTLLNDLTNTIDLQVPERNVYGNIYSDRNTVQVKGYLNAVREFQLRHSVRTICEIGFAGGHSATSLLYATGAANYMGFDEWNRPIYEDAALQWVIQTFRESNIVIYKGDSTENVPEYDGKCDVIHIDGGHQGDVPLTDMTNMARLASKHNLLLIDDCTESFPAVLMGVNVLKEKNIVSNITQNDAGWVHRGFQKGWCVGHYNQGDN